MKIKMENSKYNLKDVETKMKEHIEHELRLARFGDTNFSLVCEECNTVVHEWEEENENKK
jgi:GGDEF domain-containing protein